MLTERNFDNLVNEIIEMYSDIEVELIRLIASKLQFSDNVKPSVEWLINELNKIGALNNETLKIIAKYSGKTESQLRAMLNEVGFNSFPKIEQTEVFRNNPIIQNIINNSFNEVNNTFVQINQNIVKGVKEAYTQVLNQVYLETTTGIYDYQTSLRRAMDKMTDKGITVATYQSVDNNGIVTTRNYSIEGIIRRDLMTQVHQLAGNVNQRIIDDLNPPYIKITEHLNCREQHLPWQGCYIRPEDLVDVTDYGSITGLEGINCRHLHFAYFGEVDESQYKIVNGKMVFTQDKDIPDKEAEQRAELEKKQRYIERTIRKYKRRKEAYRDNDEEMFKKTNKKVREWQKIMRDFIDKNPDLKRQYIRERI